MHDAATRLPRFPSLDLCCRRVSARYMSVCKYSVLLTLSIRATRVPTAAACQRRQTWSGRSLPETDSAPRDSYLGLCGGLDPPSPYGIVFQNFQKLPDFTVSLGGRGVYIVLGSKGEAYSKFQQLSVLQKLTVVFALSTRCAAVGLIMTEVLRNLNPTGYRPFPQSTDDPRRLFKATVSTVLVHRTMNLSSSHRRPSLKMLQNSTG